MQRILKAAEPAKLTVFVTPSIDINIYPEDGTGQNQLPMRADLAMYEGQGRKQKQISRFFAVQTTATLLALSWR